MNWRLARDIKCGPVRIVTGTYIMMRTEGGKKYAEREALALHVVQCVNACAVLRQKALLVAESEHAPEPGQLDLANEILALLPAASSSLPPSDKSLSRCGDSACPCRAGEPCPKEDMN